MIYISHRGNIDKINIKEENKPSYIFKALDHNFNVEVDIWFIENTFYLGHDAPLYEVDMEFINTKNMVSCKKY